MQDLLTRLKEQLAHAYQCANSAGAQHHLRIAQGLTEELEQRCAPLSGFGMLAAIDRKTGSRANTVQRVRACRNSMVETPGYVPGGSILLLAVRHVYEDLYPQ